MTHDKKICYEFYFFSSSYAFTEDTLGVREKLEEEKKAPVYHDFLYIQARGGGIFCVCLFEMGFSLDGWVGVCGVRCECVSLLCL